LTGPQPPKVRIRGARAAEFEAVGELLVGAFVGEDHSQPDRSARLRDVYAHAAIGEVLVAEGPGGDLLGSVLLVPGGPDARVAAAGEMEVRLLATRPEAQRQGVGRALMNECILRASERGSRRLVLWTRESMRGARRLYERLGFMRAPGRDWPDSDGKHLLVYELVLEPPAV
jgi:ribosomal protein S18 acetylase RimI-like enzyme